MAQALQKLDLSYSFVAEFARAPAAACSPLGSYPEELTDDQILYLHELAAETRATWAAHAALKVADDTSK